MNKIFLRLSKGGKKIAKYSIFSMLFVFTFFLGMGKVSAENKSVNYPYSNDAIVAGDGACSATGLSDGNVNYILKSSNYKGTAREECVAYQFPDTPTTKYFYVKGYDERMYNTDKTKLQTIEFTINASDIGDFDFVAIYESSKTLGGATSYDLYSVDGSGNISYTLIETSGSETPQNTYYEASNINKGYFTKTASLLTFSYAIRSPVYGLNDIYINFYDAKVDTNNITKKTQVSFYIAKPIVDFASEVKEAKSACTLSADAAGKICIVYANGTLQTGEKDISVYFPKHAAFYFSTVNSHSATANSENILKYNSIYAYNSFTNVDGGNVKYLYYNASDSTTYANNTNSKINISGTEYYATLKIDARGSYAFDIVDVFGTTNTTTALTVNDLENRDLDIYFLKQKNSSSDADSSKNNNTAGDLAEFFEIVNRDSVTNKNINLVVELFYTVKIGENNAVHIPGTGLESIESNPLSTDDKGRLSVANSNYCKLFVGEGSSECLTSAQTQYKEHALTGTQTVAATYAGLNAKKSTALTDAATCASGTDDFTYGCIKNTFSFYQGTLNLDNAKAVNGTANQMNLWVNENGRYKFYVKDGFGNDKSATIDVSIIDQLQPVLSFDASIQGDKTKLCTSTYVYGGNSNYAAAVYGETGYNANCAVQSVTYNTTGLLDTATVNTGRDPDADNYLLHVLGASDNSIKAFYNTAGGKEFDYADAIRIARIKATESITSLAAKDSSAKTTTGKYYYQSSGTFTTYTTSEYAHVDNDTIIEGNYLQYSTAFSEFSAGNTAENRLRFKIIPINGSETSDKLTFCNSSSSHEDCYTIVNNYIDRGIDFKIEFSAIDYIKTCTAGVDCGNVSDTITIEVDVIDDTTPGVVEVDPSTGVVSNAKPNIQIINIDTACRIEIGNKVQVKADILNCYGFTTNTTTYNFADNKSGLKGTASLEYILTSDTYFSNILSYQWYLKYGKYDDNIKVEIATTPGTSPSSWSTISGERNIQLNTAGYYQIKFTISDGKVGTLAAGDFDNTTIIIAYYYVNPKLLLIAPQAQTVEYGTTVETLDYDVYVSGSDETFHTNIYGLTASELPKTLQNYVKANTSNNDFLNLSGRSMAGELKVIDTGAHNTAGAGIWTTGHYSINTANSVNAGAYYITLGDLHVANSGSRDQDNYIIRLHPAYLINGKSPDTTLEDYDDANVQENVSSVHLIIKQKILSIAANGGTKMYGVLDTNYKYYETTDAETNSNKNSNIAYLNGYEVTAGFTTPTYSGASIDSVSTKYNGTSIIVGALRREAGEKVGTYKICHHSVRDSGNLKNPADITGLNCNATDAFVIKAADTVTITTSNVYYYNGTGYTAASIDSSYDNGTKLIGYYVKDGSNNYYKITYDNIGGTNNMTLSVDTDTWKMTYGGAFYDDSGDALKITPNDKNGNKNYVISYTPANYTITTRELVIQPGINQGKEYSSPAHSDPVWQMVVYGEMEQYITKAASGFNGYTTDIGLSYSSTAPSNTTYDESEIYFNRRKVTDDDATYKYQYTTSVASGTGVFTLDGVEYKVVSATSICRNTGSASESECYTAATGGVFTIGNLNSVKIDGNSAIVTITGNLEYQNYTLFAGSSGTAGSGKLTRTAGETVGWYSFTDTLSTNMIPVKNNLAGDGANYTTKYNDNAPSKESGVNSYLTLNGTATVDYKPDGEHVCNDAFYSVSCGEKINPSGASIKQILFEIFKRDIVLSFNYVDDYYGYAYADYKYWYLDITSTNNATPTNKKDSAAMITCYDRTTEHSSTGKTIYTVNGNTYIASSTCSGEDQSLATDDKWAGSGTNSLNLVFKLAAEDNALFNKASGSVYALPAGLHYVSASINNENYRLIYVDYYAIKNATPSVADNHGAVDIKSSEITISATSYQKEYGQAIYATYNKHDLSGTWTTNAVNIFDLNFVGHSITSGNPNVGGGYTSSTDPTKQSATATTLVGMGALNNKNKYDSLTNVYGYTISANSGFIIAGTGTSATTHGLTVITDTIYNNFYGVPVRERGAYDGYNANDTYGLLDGVGRYTIKLDNITPTYAKYSETDATSFGVAVPNLGSTAAVSTDSTNKSMITRYTNYDIKTRNTGTLFILTAEIKIEVVSGQTKMYGCAYNGPVAGTPAWTQASGYSNCDESIADYYDFGYTYNVYGDKTFELLDNSASLLTGYTSASVANTIADHGSVNDVVYSTNASYQVKGIVSSHANATDKNNISYTVVGQATANTINNSSLNNGVLYRAKTGATGNKYNYNTYWGYANDALSKADGKYKGFQDQSVGTYVLTLGNLDAVFNKNTHCSATTEPTADGANSCKNYIVYKMQKADGAKNDLSTHTKSGTTESVSNTSLDHVYTETEFEITKREVKLHTEYNYKVYGDTDSLEGFTCAQIATMYTRTSGYNSGATFNFSGRTFGCTSADATFINMGTARYYAVDNSLAKAPWTRWSDSRQGNNASPYYLYDDILWDVMEGLLARNNESGNSLNAEYNAGGINDKVDTYTYNWGNVKLRTSNDYDKNYTFAILKADGKDQGFYNVDDNDVMQRWYGDERHNNVTTATNGGYKYYSFIIKKSGTDDFNTNYPFSNIDKEYGDAYYEIVKREIIIVADDVEKDYGIEDTYALFTIKLCSTYNTSTGECTVLGKDDEAYGNRNSLSKDDYTYFIQSGVYNQERIKGYDDDSGVGRFVGTSTNNASSTVRGSFGIYFARENGEDVGTYDVRACPTQLASGNPTCTTTGDNQKFEAGTDGTAYNAANYIITSYSGELTINKRKLKITPDSGQGFQYGNYEAGTKVAPITYKETYEYGVALNNGANGYNDTTAVNGLVNGAIGYTTAGAAISDDSLNKQYGLCLFNISRAHLTCINDRQNSTLNSSASDKAYTMQYKGNDVQSATITTTWVYHNVYNDDYTEDNDTSRMALDRVMTGNTSQRYNRNVGEYTIVAGELKTEGETVCSGTAKNCLNPNYDIEDFVADVKYTITAANVTVSVKNNQSKVYGERDVELDFDVDTTFTTDELPYDYYYCGASQTACKQTIASTSREASTEITIDGFAYAENISTATASHNYGVSKSANKSAAHGSPVSQASETGMKYFDKYCLAIDSTTSTAEGCTSTTTGTVDVSMAYTATNRILLGYLYVEGWAQTAGEHTMLSGLVVARNEHGNDNYILSYSDGSYKFTINRLKLSVDIKDVNKTYGEATDAFKCESGSCNIRTSNPNKLLTALNTENRLEFNFDVENYEAANYSDSTTGIEGDDTEIRLTKTINGKYYNQTAGKETKNVHLGLTVIRAYNSADGEACSITSDLFGCEDSTDKNNTHYKLRFLHSKVTDDVDVNYQVFIENGENEIELEDTNNQYVAITRGATKDTKKNAFEATDKFVKSYESHKLTINRRNITLFIGTYTSNELVDEKYTIEQNENLPEMPKINATMTTSSTNPKSKQVYFITWYDNDAPTAVYARQVRTEDHIRTTKGTSAASNDGSDLFGIAYCRKSIADLGVVDVNLVTSDTCKTSGTSDMIYSYDQNAKNADGTYKFDTAKIGTYAILRDKAYTGIAPVGGTYNTGYDVKKYEDKNYVTIDKNGTLVIYEDSTPPVIEVPTDMKYTIEANANVTCSEGTCTIAGKRVEVGNAWDANSLGNAIKYLTTNYSNYSNNSYDPDDEDDTTSDMIKKLGIVNSPATENADKFTLNSTTYCREWDKHVTAGSTCTRLFMVVNNPDMNADLVKDTTARSANDYDWDANLIDSELEAIASIISWFNITSYDYSYIRNGQYVAKRYTPRYYIFINGIEATENKFNPMYVGDYTISVYAIDDIGNVSGATSVTLSIKDETKPESGHLYLFNAPVKCSGTDIECATDINNWVVDVPTGGLIVPINSFVKYTTSTGTAIDDANGTYIKIGNAYKSLFGGVNRVNASGEADVTGMYVKLAASDVVAALEVEHRYWTKNATVYAVIVGGSDNSYIKATDIDTAQWQNYYKIGTNWYQYIRESKSGVAITTAEGINDVVISAIDSGRKVTANTVSHSYFNAVYLYYASGDAPNCTTLGCSDANITVDISKQTSDIINNEFNVLGTKFTLSEDKSKVTWGSGFEAAVAENEGVKQFNAGIVVCTFNADFTKITSCTSTYKGVYKNTDKFTHNISNYNVVTSSLNISDLAPDVTNEYYRDRKYVFVDKTGGSMTMVSEGYKVFEFGCSSPTGNCDGTYDEKYIKYADGSGTKGNLSVTGTAITDTAKTSKFGEISSYTVKGYTGVGTVAGTVADTDDVSSGIASFTVSESNKTYVNVMSGSEAETNLVNYFYLNIRVYFAVKSNGTFKYYKYIILWNGTSFDLYKIEKGASSYSLVGEYNASSKVNISTITDVDALLELIVSTDSSVKGGTSANDTEYQFDINYSVYDVAGNMTGTIVRGITYVKLSSMIKVDVDVATQGVSLQNTGNNTYAVSVTQGVSLANVLGNIAVSNVNNDGVNNLSSIRQSLYYNGEAIFENIGYNEDIVGLVSGYTTAPGTYTLKLTSQRSAGNLGVEYLVEDTPLEINFIVKAPVASVEAINDYSNILGPVIAFALASMAMFAIAYVSLKKGKKQD